MVGLTYMMFLLSIFTWFQSEPNKSYNQILNSHIKYAKKKYNLKLSSYGMGYPKKITKISVGFETYGPGNLNKSRKIILDLSNDLLKRINNQVGIKPYLQDVPFTEKNIEVSILYVENNGRVWFIKNENNWKNELAIVALSNGIIRYVINNNRRGPAKEMYEETFEEALKKASESN